MSRLHRILLDADTDLAEMWLALMVTAYGLAIFNPFGSVYAAGPAFHALQALDIGEMPYGGFTLLAGGLHWYALLFRSLRWRVVLALVQTTMCGFTAGMLCYGNPRGYGWWMFAVAGLMGMVVVYRLAARLERSRTWQDAADKWSALWREEGSLTG